MQSERVSGRVLPTTVAIRCYPLLLELGTRGLPGRCRCATVKCEGWGGWRRSYTPGKKEQSRVAGTQTGASINSRGLAKKLVERRMSQSRADFQCTLPLVA